ncbi:hypothetical protein ZWY2020_000668 [Hordeum vulgare]|nr:hypothetical protein ZWY2020_000668 [Hordeum vulgare]
MKPSNFFSRSVLPTCDSNTFSTTEAVCFHRYPTSPGSLQLGSCVVHSGGPQIHLPPSSSLLPLAAGDNRSLGPAALQRR